jgi:hypothetical protein
MQPLQQQASGRSTRQEGCAHLPSMKWCSIPNDQELAFALPQASGAGTERQLRSGRRGPVPA